MIVKGDKKIMVKRAKGLMVLSMTGLLAFSNVMPAFAAISTNSSGLEQLVAQDNVFKAAGIEWNFKHDVGKYMKYLGGNRDTTGTGFMAVFGADSTTPGNIYGENYVVMMRMDAGKEFNQLGLNSKTIAEVFGQSLTAQLEKSFEDYIRSTGNLPVVGGASATFPCKYDKSEYWFYSGNNLGISGGPESIKIAFVGTIKGSELYMLMYVCDGNSEVGKQLNIDTFNDIKITGSQVVSNTFNGLVANSEADVIAGEVSLNKALESAISGDVSDISSGNTTSTPVASSGASQVSKKGHTYKVPIGSTAKESGGYLYWSKADQNFWRVPNGNSGATDELAITFIDSAAYNDNTWDNYNSSADIHKYYRDLFSKVMSDRVNTTETVTDSRGRAWTLYYSNADKSYAFTVAVADNIDGVTVAVENTLFSGRDKTEARAKMLEIINGIK